MAAGKSGKSARQSGSKAPISSHPVFPAIVALWFAALFGIGSLVLPVVLFETIFAATGIANVVPAAAAPLGVTARILIALVAASIGVASGLVVARKVASAQNPAEPSRAVKLRQGNAHRDTPARAPISAHEELGERGISQIGDEALEPSRPAIAPRRRALSMTEESGRSEYLAVAPLPGGDELVFDAPAEAHDVEAEERVEALELGEFAEEAEEEHAAATESLRNTAFGTSSLSLARSQAAPAAPVQARFSPYDAGAAVHEPGAFDAPGQSRRFDAPPIAPAAFPAPLVVAPADPDEERDERESAKTVLVPPTVPFGIPEPDLELTVANAAEAVAEPADAVQLGQRPLSELGMAELVERFALSLQRREADESVRAEAAQESPTTLETEPERTFETEHEAPPTLPFAMPEPDAAPEPDVVIAVAPFGMPEPVSDDVVAPEIFPPIPVVPAALRPVGFDDEVEDDDSFDSLTLSLGGGGRRFARPDQPFAARFEAPTCDEDDEGGDGDEGYSSLLDMKNPFAARSEFVRIEDEADDDTAIEPVVVFPGQQRRAAPAADGPARDPFTAPAQARPFDPPGGMPTFGNAPATPTNPPSRKPAPGETEQALRDALAKLQKLSGAA